MTMFDTLLNLLLAGIAVSYLLEATLDSNILAHIFDRWSSRDLYTREDFRNWTLEKWPGWLFDLVHCPVCLSFHFSWILLLFVSGSFSNFGQYLLAVLAVATIGGKFYGKATPKEVPHLTEKPEAKTTAEDPEVVRMFGKEYKVKHVNGVKRQELVSKDEDEVSLLKFFSDENPFNDSYSIGLRQAYDEERAALEEKAAKDSTICSPCQLNGLQNKYYQKLRTHLRSAPAHSEVP